MPENPRIVLLLATGKGVFDTEIMHHFRLFKTSLVGESGALTMLEVNDVGS